MGMEGRGMLQITSVHMHIHSKVCPHIAVNEQEVQALAC